MRRAGVEGTSETSSGDAGADGVAVAVASAFGVAVGVRVGFGVEAADGVAVEIASGVGVAVGDAATLGAATASPPVGTAVGGPAGTVANLERGAGSLRGRRPARARSRFLACQEPPP